MRFAGGIIPFSFDDTLVRVVNRDGEGWFMTADICRVLELENPRNATARLDDEKGVQIMDASGGAQDMTVINESGLTLILTSRKPAAKRFRKWVTAEVLPLIRQTGGHEAAVGDLREMLAILVAHKPVFGAATRALWAKLGLPLANPAEDPQAKPDVDPSEWRACLRHWQARVDAGSVEARSLARMGVPLSGERLAVCDRSAGLYAGSACDQAVSCPGRIAFDARCRLDRFLAVARADAARGLENILTGLKKAPEQV